MLGLCPLASYQSLLYNTFVDCLNPPIAPAKLQALSVLSIVSDSPSIPSLPFDALPSHFSIVYCQCNIGGPHFMRAIATKNNATDLIRGRFARIAGSG